MSKFTVKTTVNNIIYDPKADSFSYTEEFVSMKWTESKEREKYTQSGTGPGEFGPDYSDRKKYQLGYGNESPSPVLKEFLVNTHRNPRESTYVPHVIEPYNTTEETKMACNNIDCHCENCTCDPCDCSIDNPCGCDEKDAYQGAKKKSRPTGRITNEWKGLV